MTAFTIVPDFDIVENLRASGATVFPNWISELALHAPKETLDASVVPALTFSRHARDDSVRTEDGGEVVACILASAIRMKERSALGPPISNCGVESVEHKSAMHGLTHRPADHPTRRKIEHDREIEPTFARSKISDVAGPDLILVQLLQIEIAAKNIGCYGQRMIGIRRLSKSARQHADEPMRLHNASDAFLTNANALGRELSVNAWTSIGLAAFGMSTNHGLSDRNVYRRTHARSAAAPLIESSAGNLQEFAHPSNVMLRPLLVDERISHRDSLAKNAAALFKISRSSRRFATSRRKRRFSSSRDIPGCASASVRSTCANLRRHVCSRFAWIPNSRATCVSVLSRTFARRIASRLNSSLKDRRSFPMTLHRRSFAGYVEVSGESGQAQNKAVLLRARAPQRCADGVQGLLPFELALATQRKS